MQLIILGLNHKTAPLSLREAFALSKDDIETVLYHLDTHPFIMETVLLSTCNRTELYAVLRENSDFPQLLEFFFSLAPKLKEHTNDIMPYIYKYQGQECIEHLFSVASSLDSLVLGESQIISQVKKAYALAKESGATGTILNLLFNRAVATGKRVRSETLISHSAVSVSYAAVELLKKYFAPADFKRAQVLICGAGETAELTIKNLTAQGVEKLYIANRHLNKAEILAQKFNGTAIPFQDAFSLSGINIVITSTGAPHFVVTPENATELCQHNPQGKIFFIDIAVPRDVDPDITKRDNIVVYNIDDLQSVVSLNRQKRQLEAIKAKQIIAEETKRLLEKFRYLSARPSMVQLSEKAERIRKREVKRAMHKLENLNSNEKKSVEQLSKMLVRKLLREPMVAMTSSVGTDEEGPIQSAVRTLFSLEMPPNTSDIYPPSKQHDKI